MPYLPLFPNLVVSFSLFWLGYILNGATLSLRLHSRRRDRRD